MIQKGLNALYGAVRWMHDNRDPAIALNTEFDDVPASTTYQPAMQGLEHFLDKIGQRGFTLQRDFPPDRRPDRIRESHRRPVRPNHG